MYIQMVCSIRERDILIEPDCPSIYISDRVLSNNNDEDDCDVMTHAMLLLDKIQPDEPVKVSTTENG